MRFIGNNHALHFGGVTFVNRVTLLQTVTREMERFGKSEADQQELANIIHFCIDEIEDELRQELKQKHYHADLHIPEEK